MKKAVAALVVVATLVAGVAAVRGGGALRAKDEHAKDKLAKHKRQSHEIKKPATVGDIYGGLPMPYGYPLPTRTTEATGYWWKACVREVHFDRPAMKDYDEEIEKQDREPMEPEVCFEFCKSAKPANAFGITRGNKCHCFPFEDYEEASGGPDNMCDSPCPGDETKTCGGLGGMTDVYQMHDCNNLPDVPCTRPPALVDNAEKFKSRYYLGVETPCANTQLSALTVQGEKCQVKCLPGYVLLNNNIDCVQMGDPLGYTWAQVSGKAACISVTCGPPPVAEHAKYPQAIMRYPDEITYTCQMGYSIDQLSTGAREFDVGCLVTAAFSQTQKCLAVKCGLCPTQNHTACQETGERFYKDTCTYGCDTGYTLDGLANGAANFATVCLQDGTFSEMIMCKPVTCGQPIKMQNSLFGTEQVYFPNAAEYTCELGYTTSGEVGGPNTYSRKCLADGALEEIPDKCLPVKCGAPLDVQNSSYSKNTLYFKDIVTYTCQVGFTTTGNAADTNQATATCEETGLIRPQGIKCLPVKCPAPPTINLADVITPGGAPSAMDFASPPIDFQCKAGYSLNPNDNPYSPTGNVFQIFCLANGLYTTSPTCVDINDCNWPGLNSCAPDGKCENVVPPSGTPIDDFNCHCNPGYENLQEATKKGAQTKICHNINDCPTSDPCGVPAAKFRWETVGVAVGKNQGSFWLDKKSLGVQGCYDAVMADDRCHRDGSNAYFSYRNRGDKNCGCRKEADLQDGEGLELVKDDTADTYVILFAGACVDGLMTYTCSCETGYEIGHMQSPAKNETCTPMVCGALPTIANASMALNPGVPPPPPSVATYDTAIWSYTCDKGYTTTGEVGGVATFTGRCNELGNFDATPDCLPVTCNTPEIFAFTSVTFVGAQVTYLEQAAYTCDVGYTLDGTTDGKKTYTTSCQADGTFTAPEKCLPIECGAPTAPQNARAASGTYVYLEEALITCDSGYSLDGTTRGSTKYNLHCLSNGSFSRTPECLPVSCGVPHIVNHANRDATARVYKEKVTYTLDPGYTLNGEVGGATSFEVTCQANGQFTAAPTVTPVLCGNAPKRTKALLLGAAGAMRFGDYRSYQCDQGYTVDGKAKGAVFFDINCQDDGKFGGLDGCKPKECPAFDTNQLEFATQGPDTNGQKLTDLVYLQLANFKCNPGYSLDAAPESVNINFKLTCKADGTIQYPAAGKCKRNDDCAGAGNSCSPNGKCANVNPPTGDHYKDFECKCNSGFKPNITDGGKVQACGQIPDCPKDACLPGQCRDLTNDFMCLCPPGYKQVKEGEFPQVAIKDLKRRCEAITCGDVEKLDFSSTLDSRKEVKFTESAVQYSCDNGYSLDGNVGGEMDFEVGCVLPKLACSDHDAETDCPIGRCLWTGSACEDFPLGGVVDGPFVVFQTCGKSGDSVKFYYAADGGSVPAKETFTELGSVAALGSSAVFSNGIWSSHDFSSTEFNKYYIYANINGADTNPTKMDVVVSRGGKSCGTRDTCVATKLEQTCEDGKFGINFCHEWCNADKWPGCGSHTLSGNDPRNTDGQDYTCRCYGCNGCANAVVEPCFDNGDATCQPIHCKLPTIANGASADTGKTHIEYKETAKYTCASGYTIDADAKGSSEFTVTCTTDGSLSGLETCEPVKCAIPSGSDPLGPHASFDTTKAATLVYPQVLIVSCDAGYALNTAAYQYAGEGVAQGGGEELWQDVYGKGLDACYDWAVTNPKCNGDYFTYVHKGDKNCGCKPNGANMGALTLRKDDVSTHYKMLPPAYDYHEIQYTVNCESDGVAQRAKNKAASPSGNKVEPQVCKAVNCGPPPQVADSTYSGSVFFGGNMVYTAITGFSVDGAASSSKTADMTCLADGTWSTIVSFKRIGCAAVTNVLNMKSMEVAKAENCLKIVTGTASHNDGTLNWGAGRGIEDTSGKMYQKGEVVVDTCFFFTPVVWVHNPTSNAWTGSIMYSEDGGQTWANFWGGDGWNTAGNTDKVVVDGNGDGSNQASTRCLNGATCGTEMKTTTTSTTTTTTTITTTTYSQTQVEGFQNNVQMAIATGSPLCPAGFSQVQTKRACTALKSYFLAGADDAVTWSNPNFPGGCLRCIGYPFCNQPNQLYYNPSGAGNVGGESAVVKVCLRSGTSFASAKAIRHNNIATGQVQCLMWFVGTPGAVQWSNCQTWNDQAKQQAVFYTGATDFFGNQGPYGSSGGTQQIVAAWTTYWSNGWQAQCLHWDSANGNEYVTTRNCMNTQEQTWDYIMNDAATANLWCGTAYYNSNLGFVGLPCFQMCMAKNGQQYCITQVLGAVSVMMKPKDDNDKQQMFAWSDDELWKLAPNWDTAGLQDAFATPLSAQYTGVNLLQMENMSEEAEARSLLQEHEWIYKDAHNIYGNVAAHAERKTVTWTPVNPKYDDYVVITCADGYKAKYSSKTGAYVEINASAEINLYCQENGELEKTYPVGTDAVGCVPVSCVLDPITNASYYVPEQTSGFISYPEKQLQKCSPGYSLTGKPLGGDQHYESCQADGNMTKSAKCQEIDWCVWSKCGSNGQCEVDSDGLGYGCKCDLGYKEVAVDSANSTCEEIDECTTQSGSAACAGDANQGTCNNEIGKYTCTCIDGYEVTTDDDTGFEKCTAKVCPSLPKTPNANPPQPYAKIPFPESVEFTCDVGHAIDGVLTDGNKFTVSCKSDGTLSEFKSCDPVKCGTLATRTKATPNTTELAYGSVAKFTCDAGHSIGGARIDDSAPAMFVRSMTEKNKKVCPVEDVSFMMTAEEGAKDDKCNQACLAQDSCYGTSTYYGSNDHLDATTVAWCIGCKSKPVEQAGADLMVRQSYKAPFPDVTSWRVRCSSQAAFLDPRDGEGCQPVNCGIPKLVLNSKGLASKGDLLYGSPVDEECLEGYSIDGTVAGDKKFPISCQASGAFDGIKSCVPITCGKPSVVTQGVVPNTVEFTFGQSFALYCNNGYELQGTGCSGSAGKDAAAAENLASLTIHCNADGKFEAGGCGTTIPTECKPVSCGKPESTANATTTDPAKVFLESATWTCKAGFSTNGDPGGPSTYNRDCKSTKIYGSAPPSSCKDINFCVGNPCGANGVCTDSGVGDVSPGYSCACYTGYEVTVTDGKPTCTEDECYGNPCGVGKGTCTDLSQAGGAQGQYTCNCNAGYESVLPPATYEQAGSGVAGQGSDEVWMRQFMGQGEEKCFKETLQNPDCYGDYFTYVHNGDKNCGCKGKAGQLDVRDDQGKSTYYKIDKPVGTPHCARASCGNFPQSIPNVEMANGKIDIKITTWNSHPVKMDAFKNEPMGMSFDSGMYTCATGYSTDGSNNVEAKTFNLGCDGSGNWDKTVSNNECIKVRCDNWQWPLLPSTTLQNPKDFYVYDEDLIFKCGAGHTVDGTVGGSSTFNVKCQADGSFEDPHPSCNPISCSVDNRPGSTHSMTSSVTYDTSVSYSCDNGYVATKEKTYDTAGSGAVAGGDEIWNVGNMQGQGVEKCFQAVLVEATCNGDYFTYVNNGDKNCGCKGSAGGLETRADGISTYYKITAPSTSGIPSKSTAFNGHCGADGKLSFAGGDACEPISCGTFSAQPNAKTVGPQPNNDKLNFKSQPVVVNCLTGFSLGGLGTVDSYTIRCDSTGSIVSDVTQTCDARQFEVAGDIYDATDRNKKIGAVTLVFKNHAGEVVATVQSTSYGKYSTRLVEGTYTIATSKSGYIDSTRTLLVQDHIQQGGDADLFLSASLPLGEWRVVLTWAAHGRDLDSWTYFGTSKVGFYSKSRTDSNGMSATLDWDWTQGFGPETTTFKNVGFCEKQGADCIFYFKIHNYVPSDGAMGISQGHMRLFAGDDQGGRIAAEMDIPTSTGDALWYDAYTLYTGDPPEVAIGRAQPAPYVSFPDSNNLYPWRILNFGQSGLRSVRSNELITGLSATGDLTQVSSLSKAAGVAVGATDGLDCVNQYVEWPASGGYVECQEGTYMQGMTRSYSSTSGADPKDIKVITSFRCCKPKEAPYKWGTCSDQSAFASGTGYKRCSTWAKQTVPSVLVGFRMLHMTSGAGLTEIQSIKCCYFPTMDLVPDGAVAPQPLVQAPPPTAAPTPMPPPIVYPTPAPPTPAPPTPKPPTPAPPTPSPTPAPYWTGCSAWHSNGCTGHPLSWYQGCPGGYAYRGWNRCGWANLGGYYVCERQWSCVQNWVGNGWNNCCR